ncbi:uncharacterized protein LOC142622063 [Castanea sativa]|uniref:uncharacterized protein LOC142622063 n=1 Tax=Castanea sativa TaxID=21020 RepID=UPI003F64CDB2
MFAHQIGRNVQAYVDDMLVKSIQEDDHLSNLQVTFDTLRSYNMKLNPNKCVFGVTVGKFLGFMVSQRGIEVSPEKIQAIMEIAPPKTVKEVQSLNGKIVALNRFVSRQSKPREELFLYLAVSLAAISAALIREKDRVYFTSRALRQAEQRYPQMEKLAFTLVTATRKLKLYFQAMTDKPLRRAMSSPEAAGRMALWAVKPSQGPEEVPQWSIHIDESSNKQVGGAGVVLYTLKGDKIECMIRLNFPMTNNEAEYEALIAGLDLAKAAGAKNVVEYCDSQVITSQVNDNYECKSERMKRYLEEVKGRISSLQMKLVQIPREENKCANQLAKAASVEHMLVPNQVLSFVQLSSLIDNTNVQDIGYENCWIMPIAAYLRDGELPDDKEAARRLKVQAACFILIKNVLYKRGFSRPYLRCLVPKEADYVMREVHEGIFRNHSGSWSLVHKLIRVEYYWPTM